MAGVGEEKGARQHNSHGACSTWESEKLTLIMWMVLLKMTVSGAPGSFRDVIFSCPSCYRPEEICHVQSAVGQLHEASKYKMQMLKSVYNMPVVEMRLK